MTYTYAVLDVSESCYREVRKKLEAAGYQHAFHADGAGEAIDMHGIALRAQPAPGRVHPGHQHAIGTDGKSTCGCDA